MEKKIKNEDPDTGSHQVGDEIVPVAGAARHYGGLHDLSQSAVSDADDDGQKEGLVTVGLPVGDELLAVAPQA